MRILITGDWHLTNKRPRSRIDDYVSVQKEKVAFIFEKAIEHKCHIIAQPGDLTDKWDFKDKFKVTWINFLRGYIHGLNAPNIISIPGQHDMRYHTSDLSNTPIGVLKAGVGFTVIDHEHPQPLSVLIHQPAFYGAGWGMPIPKILHPDNYNILITHRMIVADKLWAGQEDYEVAGTFLRRNKFDLVISGDNHNKFFQKHDGRCLFNCGSLMRNRIDQVNHQPTIVIFDTVSRRYEEIFIPIKPFNEVVNIEEVEAMKEKDEKLSALKDILKKKSKIKGLDYKKRVYEKVTLLKKAKSLSRRAEGYIEEVMEDG